MSKSKVLFNLSVAILMVVNLISPIGFLIVPQAQAATLGLPTILSYQGRLKTAAGVALTGSYDMSFRLYDALTGGTLLWTEAHSGVTVTSGYFSTILGETTTFVGAVDFTKNLWLDISVGPAGGSLETMTARVPINSVAFAMAARGVEQVASAPATNLYGGRMYYNTTSGKVYVYNAVTSAWVDTTSASTNLDDAYNNFGTTAPKVVVDAAQGQTEAFEIKSNTTSALFGDIEINLASGGDFIVQDNGTAFATFDDAGGVTLANDLAVNGGDVTSTGALTVNPTGALNLGGAGTTSVATANTVTTYAIDGTGLTTFNIATSNSAAATLNLATSNKANNINLGTGSAVDTIHIGDGAGADAITIGAVTGNTAITSANWSITTAGLITTAGDIVVNGDDIDADGDLDVSGATGLNLIATANNLDIVASAGNVTITSTGAGNDVTVTTADDFSVNGVAGAVYNIGTTDIAQTLNLGTGIAIDAINIGTGATGVDVIRIGQAAADLALTDADWSITTAGLFTTAGDLAVNGNDITATGDLTITGATGANLVATTGTLDLTSSAGNLTLTSTGATSDIALTAGRNLSFTGVTGTSAFYPTVDSAYNLGTAGLYWANAYIDTITTTGNVNVGGSISAGSGTSTITGTLSLTSDLLVGAGTTLGDNTGNDITLVQGFMDIRPAFATNANLLDIQRSTTSVSGDALNILMKGVADPSNIGDAIDIAFDGAAVDGNAAVVSMGTTNLAGGAFVVTDAGGARTDAVVDITAATTGAGTDASSLFQINSTGALAANSNVMDVNLTAGGASNVFDVTYSTTANTGNAVDLNMGTNVAGNALNIAGSNRTADVVSITADSNSASVDGIYLNLDVATALSAGEILNGLNIDVDGLAGDNATAQTNGLFLTTANTTGGVSTGILLGGTWDTGLDLSGSSLTTDIILDDGLTISQTSDNDLDIVENGVTLNLDFAEANAATITYSSASDIDFTSSADGEDAIEINATAGGVNILASGAAAGEDIDITATGSSVNITSTEVAANAIVLNASAGGVDITAATNDMDLVASTTDINLTGNVNIDLLATTGDITLTTTTGTGDDIVLTSANDIILDADAAAGNTITLDAYDGTNNTTGAVSVLFGSGDMIVTGTGASADFTLDADLLSIDGTGTSNVTVTGTDGEDFTVSQIGAADASLILSSTGTAADALQITTSAGGMDLTVAGAAADEDLDLLSNTSINITATEAAANAIVLNASAGGVDITAATNEIDLVATLADVNITASATDINVTGNVNVDLLATTGDVTLTTTTGTGDDIILTSADDIMLDADAALGNIITLDAYSVTNTSGSIVADFGTGNMIITGTGASADFTLDADLISIDGTGTSNVSVTGADGEDFTVSQIGAADASLILSSTGTAADALQITTSAGGMDLTVAGAAAGEDMDLLSNTSINITATEDVAQAIYLHANGGTSETIQLHADQGTAVNSLNLLSDVGGITLSGGLGTADAINITTSNTLGGIDVDFGTGDMVIVGTGANADFTVDVANGGISLDSGTSSNFTVTGNNQNLLLYAAGTGGAQELQLQSAGTGATALNVDSAGGFDLLTSGAAAGAGDITMHSDLASITLTADEADAQAIYLNAAAGGIDIDADSTITINTSNDEIQIATGNQDVVLSGSAEGTAALTLNLGDIVLTDGDLTLTSGQIEIPDNTASFTVLEDATGGADYLAIATTDDAETMVLGHGTMDSLTITTDNNAANDVAITGGLTVTSAATQDSFTITSSADTGNAQTITGNSLTTGSAIGITITGTTGGGIIITDTTADTTMAAVGASGAYVTNTDASPTAQTYLFRGRYATDATATNDFLLLEDNAGDDMFTISENGATIIAGTAGADVFTITAGDAVLSDGSLTITDADNAASFALTNNTITDTNLATIGSTSLTTGSALRVTLTEANLTTGNYFEAYDATGTATVFEVGEDGVTTIAGSALGTDALALTNGDILVSSGNFDLTTGDFNIGLVDGQSANIDGDGSPTADLLVVGNGDTTITDAVDGVFIDFAGTDVDGNAALNIDFDNNVSVAAVDTTYGIYMNVDNDEAQDNVYGLYIQNDTAATSAPDAFIYLANPDAAVAVTDGIFFANPGADAMIVDAIDAAAANITNAINIGANTILGTTGVINFDNFDVFGDGRVGITVANTATTGGAIEINRGTYTTTANSSGLGVTMTGVTGANTFAVYGLSVTDIAAGDAGGTEYAIYQAGTNWDYGLYLSDNAYMALDLSVIGGDITGANGNAIDIGEASDGSITFSRDDAGTVTLTAVDSDANAILQLIGGGTQNVQIATDADSEFDITALAAPTADIVTITTNGNSTATANVDALAITFQATNAGTNNVINMAPTFADTDADGTADSWNVMNVNAFTATLSADAGGTLFSVLNGLTFGILTETVGGDETINSTMLNLATTGWDTGIALGANSIVGSTSNFDFTNFDVNGTTGKTDWIMGAAGQLTINAYTTGNTTTDGVINMTIDSTTTGNEAIYVDYEVTDDGSAGTESIINLLGTMTSNDGDNLYGLNIGALAGTAAAGNEYAINVGSGWDAGLYIGSTIITGGNNIALVGTGVRTGNMIDITTDETGAGEIIDVNLSGASSGNVLDIAMGVATSDAIKIALGATTNQAIVIDATTADPTTTDGIVDINWDSSTDSSSAVNIAANVSNATGEALKLDADYTTGTADNFNVIGIDDFNAATTVNVVSEVNGISIGNLAQTENTPGNITATALKIGGGWDYGITLGANILKGTTSNIDFDNFDVAATGAVTIVPSANTTALTLTGTSVTSADLLYLNAKNNQGNILDIAYGAAQTLSGNLVGQVINLLSNLTPTNYNVIGSDIRLPDVTNTGAGNYLYRGLTVSGGSLTQASGGGTDSYHGLEVSMPSIVQTSGTITSSGVDITTGNITTGGTENGVNIAANGVGAGTLTGINISTITSGAGTETAISIGTGWDIGIQTSSGIAIGAQQTLTANSATPLVAGISHAITANTVPVLYTNFTGGTAGQLLVIEVNDAFSTFDCVGSEATINCGAVDIAAAAGDILTWVKDATVWNLINWVDISVAQAGGDLAEYYASRDALTAGDVVSIDRVNAENVKLSSGAKSADIVGVVSTTPWNTMGVSGEGKYAIALAGNTAVKVTNENGAIRIGDYITSSSTPGYGMKANAGDPTVGIALTAFDSEIGAVNMLISRNNGSQIIVAEADTFGIEIVVHTTFNRDSAGQAKILEGDSEVYVDFDQECEYIPIINVTRVGLLDVSYGLKEVTKQGFYIEIDSDGDGIANGISADIVFNWMAVAVDGGAKIHVSDGTTEDVDIVVVESSVDSAPVITLNGEDTINLVVGASYEEFGAAATDTEDGDITGSIAVSGGVDTAIAGTYAITYSVTDSGSNTVIVTRTVIVSEL